jgi:uncharacterized protein YraI
MRQPASARPAPVCLTLVMVFSVLMSGLVSAIALPAQPAAADPASTSSEVNLRTGPGESYDILSVVPVGAAITVDGDAVDGFFPATYNGVSGWVSASYVVAGATGTVSGYETPATQVDPNTTYYEAGTVVVYETEAGANQQRGNRRNRDNINQPPTTTTTTTTSSPDAAIPNPGAPAGNEEAIISIIHQAANAYGQDPEAMVRVARCESSLNPRAIDASGSYHGLFQFVPVTFAATPYGGQDIYDPWANSHAAAWMWSEGRKSEWVCQ